MARVILSPGDLLSLSQSHRPHQSHGAPATQELHQVSSHGCNGALAAICRQAAAILLSVASCFHSCLPGSILHHLASSCIILHHLASSCCDPGDEKGWISGRSYKGIVVLKLDCSLRISQSLSGSEVCGFPHTIIPSSMV